MIDAPAFQDQIPGNYCWGCGPLNEYGLQIKSYWSGDESVCKWQPQHHFMAGPQHVLNGGIITSLMDCHCICTAMAAAYRSQGRSIGTEPLIWYATGSIQMTFRRPTPIEEHVTLRAWITETTDKKTTLSCSLSIKGDECAVGEVVAIRVAPEWLRQA